MITPSIPTDAEPVVGQFYRVPCIIAQYSSGRSLPLLGERHRDPEIGTPAAHFHYDLRFFSDDKLAAQFGIGLWDKEEIAFEIRQAMAHIVTWTGPIHQRRLKCQRQMPEFPVQAWSGNAQRVTPKLESIYAGRTIDTTSPVCPHKKMPLAGLPQDGEGCVVCPLHGLKWNLRTGEMAARDYPKQNSSGQVNS